MVLVSKIADKLLLYSIIGCMVLWAGSGCEGPTPPPKPPSVLNERVVAENPNPPPKIEEIDLESVKTIGNHSWVPINKEVTPEDIHEKILKILDAFEKAHGGWEITSWAIEKRQSAYQDGRGNHVSGLWINHKRK